MSSQKGNAQRSRPQKYKNRTAFKNNLHDTSNRTKLINSMHVSDVCVRCKDIIEWKIKYKKYKPLTQPRKCIKCEQKNVKQAYHVMCGECGRQLKVCTKCCQAKELVVVAQPSEQEQLQLDNEMKNLLQSLSERKRRTFMRYMNKKGDSEETKQRNKEEQKEDLMGKLNALKLANDDNDDFDSIFHDSDSDLDSLNDES